jgi:hypothetical protein
MTQRVKSFLKTKTATAYWSGAKKNCLDDGFLDACQITAYPHLGQPGDGMLRLRGRL